MPTATPSPSLSFKFLRHIPSLPRSYSYDPSSLDVSSLQLAPPPRPSPGAGPVLDPDVVHRMLQTVREFRRRVDLEDGSLVIRLMEQDELEGAVQLLAESFGDSMWLPPKSMPVLTYLVKQYVLERRRLVPHVAFLVGLYSDKGGGEVAQLAGMAEISFDAIGANGELPTPTPPRDCPYISNITVTKTLRRKKIGKHLLMACEELISRMKVKRTVYLHCRVSDKIPFSMYQKAKYKVVKKDSILIWLRRQRRNHLMCKELPPVPDEGQSVRYL